MPIKDIIGLILKWIPRIILMSIFGFMAYIVYSLSHPFSYSTVGQKDAMEFVRNESGVEANEIERILFSGRMRVSSLQDAHTTDGVTLKLTPAALSRLSASGAIFPKGIAVAESSRPSGICFDEFLSRSSMDSESLEFLRLPETLSAADAKSRLLLMKSPLDTRAVFLDRKTGIMAVCHQVFGIGSRWNE